MSLREELQNRADKLDAELLALSGRIRAIEHESDDVHTCINALDLAEMDAQDAALEPAPAEPEEDWTNGGEDHLDAACAELLADDDVPAEFISDLTGDPAIQPESGLHGEPVDAYYPSEQEQAIAFASIDADPEPTELDAEPVSVLDNPELLAAVERAEATLAIDAQTCEPIYPHPQPNYVGLQDPELDADYEAMREREKADKPKLHFSIFGERGNRKLEEV